MCTVGCTNPFWCGSQFGAERVGFCCSMLSSWSLIPALSIRSVCGSNPRPLINVAAVVVGLILSFLWSHNGSDSVSLRCVVRLYDRCSDVLVQTHRLFHNLSKSRDRKFNLLNMILPYYQIQETRTSTTLITTKTTTPTTRWYCRSTKTTNSD